MKILHLAILIGASIGGIMTTIVILQMPHTMIQIKGLDDIYTTGKPIDFFVTANGYGKVCDGPQVHILDVTNQSNVIWWGSYPAFTGPYCNPHQFNFTFHAGEHYGTPPHTNHPIIINKTGNYMVKASLGNTNSEEQFSVIHTSTLDCRKWTQNGWIAIPCSTPSLPH